MLISNASPFPTPSADALLLPQFLSLDRGYFVSAIDPALGNTLVEFPPIDPVRFASVVTLAQAAGGHLVFDIEVNPIAANTTSASLFAEAVNYFMSLIARAHGAGLKVGLFGLPISFLYDGNYLTSRAVQDSNNALLLPLYNKLDYLCPCLYSDRLGDLVSWENNAAAILKWCQLNVPTVPIRPFISPRSTFSTITYESKSDFYRKLIFLRDWDPTMVNLFWDANIPSGSDLSTHSFYNMIKLSATFDPIYPPDSGGYLS